MILDIYAFDAANIDKGEYKGSSKIRKYQTQFPQGFVLFRKKQQGPSIEGCDYEIVRDVPGKPVKINLLVFPGERKKNRSGRRQYLEMLFLPEEREVFHIYSDSLSKLVRTVPCYSINEVLSEKLRALIQHSYTAPRDFYDIWYIANIEENLNWQEITKAFHRKMEVKGLIFTGIDQMINPENDKRLKAAWHNSLGHQIKKEFLPEYEKVKKDLKIIIKSIFSDS